MSGEPAITQTEMDKYFETGGKEAPAALVEAEKQEQAPIENTEVPRGTIKEPVKEIVQATEKPTESVETKSKHDGEVQVQVEGKTVPLSELISERKARQAWEQTANAQQQQLTEMLALVREKAKTLTPAQENAAPDPNTDPFGYINHVLGNVQSTTQELQQWRKTQETQAQAQELSNRKIAWATAQSQEFSTKQADFPKAYDFAREGRTRELQALGMDSATIQSTLEAEQAGLIDYAAQRTIQGIPTNPAQLVYEYAKARGYKAEIVAEAKKAPDLDDKLRTISKGQEAAKGLSGTSGGVPTEINNLQDLAAASGDMSDDEFSKAFDKLVPKMKGKYV